MRAIARLRAIVYRAEKDGLGRNAEASGRAACNAYKDALTGVLKIEDTQGVEAAAKLSDKLLDLRQRAVAAALMSAWDVTRIEREVIA